MMTQEQIDAIAEQMRRAHYERKEMVMTASWEDLPEHRRDNWRHVVSLAQTFMLDPIREALIKVLPCNMFDPDAKPEPNKNVWECKIGYALDKELPKGADAPLRNAVENAFEKMTGDEADFVTSGWGAILAPGEEHEINTGEVSLAHQDAWLKVRELIHGSTEKEG